MAWRGLRLLLAVVFSVSGLNVTNAFAAEASPVIAQADGSAQLAQETKKKRKKGKKGKRKKGGGDAEAPAESEAAGGSNLHVKQEGVETPYKWQVSLLSDFVVNNETTGEAKTGSADYSLAGKAGYIIASSIILGLGLDYYESSFKTEEDTNTSSEYLIRFFFDYVFGDLDKDDMLFFVELGLGIGSSESKTGEVESKGSSSQFGLGLGLHYFIDSNVAFTGQFSYDTGSRKVDGQDDPTKFTSMHLMRLGFSLFI